MILSILVWSWVIFTSAILVTLLSFIASQFAYDRQLKLAQQYYLENNDAALQDLNKPAFLTKVLNILSTLLFIVAVILLLIFAYANTNVKNGVEMSDEKTKINKGVPPPNLIVVPNPPKEGIDPALIVELPTKPQCPHTSTGIDNTNNKAKRKQ